MVEAETPQAPEKLAETKCGFVALLGAPNSGKSTLINALTGAKVSIVTPKVQTTRNRILGIAMFDTTQVVLMDTPGIFEPKKRLDRAMVAAAWQGSAEADLTILIVDANRVQNAIDPDTSLILRGLNKSKRKALLVLNKIDLVDRSTLLRITETLNATATFSDTFMISALKGDGLSVLRQTLATSMPESPFLFPEDQLSDMPERLLAAEITREKLFLNLHQELPYALTVETEQWKTLRDGSLRIEQTIYVQRENQRAIVLGKQGQGIKRVGALSRRELTEILGHKVHLFLFVKVRKNWQDDPERYRDWGLDFTA